MPHINIWGRYLDHKPKVMDRASSEREAEYLLSEYRLVFGPKFKLWVGRRIDEPKKEVGHGLDRKQ